MPSPSPNHVKRPSLTERTSSTHSLSSSAKQTSTIHKVHRPHVVARHSRNLSHGKNLSKLNKVHSTASVNETKNHQRKKSATSDVTPAQSPKSPGLPKRNSSHVSLPKNSSHGDLRKNHSATALARNPSHTTFKKVGLPPAPMPKNEKKTGFFELGDQSSGEEEEAQWEDSNTMSPELTRNNSKSSTPARVQTPNGDVPTVKTSEPSRLREKRTSSPPSPSLPLNRSLPDLRKDQTSASDSYNPPLLHQNGRASRAPPAMSTVLATAGPSGLKRNDSSRSFTHVNVSEEASNGVAAGTPGPGSSSAERPVSHFLSLTPGSTDTRIEDGSDEDSINFMTNYKPQPSESPEKQRNLNHSRLAALPSRTQQKLELQRREMMRTGGGPTTPPQSSIGLNVGSSLSLHSRSGSRGRNRSFAEEMKAQKVDYETGIKQLTVVRRFRNPVIESLNRLKASGVLPADLGVATSGTAKIRPQSRRGVGASSSTNPWKDGLNWSPDGKRPAMASSQSTRGRGGKVHFQQQGSPDDIGITPSAESPEVLDDEEDMSPEQALMRRIWSSREVYDSGEATVTR